VNVGVNVGENVGLVRVYVGCTVGPSVVGEAVFAVGLQEAFTSAFFVSAPP
jgi:hypothetical protein